MLSAAANSDAVTDRAIGVPLASTPLCHYFEVHRLWQNRWRSMASSSTSRPAIEDAKLLLARTHAFDAVRVLQVEEAESGFFEWAVYIGTRPQEHHRRRA